MSDWQTWLMLHPESVAYQMYDGKRYQSAPLPTEFNKEAADSMGEVDDRLKPMANVMGISLGGKSKAFPLDDAADRAVFTDTIDGQPVAVFWYGPTQTAVAFLGELDGEPLTFYTGKGGPETAPFNDRETQTRWTLAGRAVDGKLRGKELKWVDSIQSRWYAWSAEYPETELFQNSEQPGAGAAAAAAKSAAKLELRLGHLCDQKGCVEHLRKSLGAIAGLGNIDAMPGPEQPGATVELQLQQQAFDVWSLREKLRDQGIEVAGLKPKGLSGYGLRIDLPRRRQPVVEVVESVDWTTGVSAADGAIDLGVGEGEVDLIALLDAITESGAAPSAVWLVPAGAPMPKAPRELPAASTAEPKTGGSDVHPVVEFDLVPPPDAEFSLTAMLNQPDWASRTRVVPGKVTLASASIGDRKYARLTPLVDQFQKAGHTPTRIRLRDFGDIRIELEFAHICGEVLMSKPPKPKKDAEKKKDEKPFVPKAIRPADSSNGFQGIKAAVESVQWIRDGIFLGYHSRFEFRSPTKLRIGLKAGGEDVVRLDELIEALHAAGFPPKTMSVSRLHPGLPFGTPLPPRLKLTDREGNQQTLASLKHPDRPLAFAFVSLKCERSKYKDYQPDPKFYGQLGKTIELYEDRVDVIAVCSSPKDEFTEVAGFWDKTGLNASAPMMHDAQGAVRGILNAQMTPPPHLYVFDADGRLRFAGDPHDHWGKPEQEKDDFFARALDLVLAGKYQENGAVFYNSKPCDCAEPTCSCPKCRCGSSCRCGSKHCGVGF